MSRPMKETNIPWIGQVPVPWGVVKLKKVANAKKKKNNKRSDVMVPGSMEGGAPDS